MKIPPASPEELPRIIRKKNISEKQAFISVDEGPVFVWW